MTVSPVLRAFLDPDNQTLLWSIVSQHELFQPVLTEPERWFQSILEMTFTKAQSQAQAQAQAQSQIEGSEESLYDQLKTLNQETLLYMVKDLQTRGSSFSRTQLLVQPTSISGMVEQETKMIFAVEKDEPIKNLDERILEQQQFREKQDYIFPAPPAFSQPKTDI